MAKIKLGRTGLIVEQNGFGALPIQRISRPDAVYLLQKAQAGGMNYFDTARGYSDSEEKISEAFAGRRSEVIIASKTFAQTADAFWRDLETSLSNLKTDHIDVYQFHNPPFCPRPGDESGMYDAMLKAREQGKIRFIGITNHRLPVALEAVDSGLYDTLQFPFSYLASDKDLAVVKACAENDIGFVAMKALSGGLITNAAAACAWICQHKNVVPIWGIQLEKELDDFLACIPVSPVCSEDMLTIIEADRQDLQGNFCRACGYCMPCPQGIEINTCARASQLMRRAPKQIILSEKGQAMMRQIENCTECGQCAAKCPYELDTPALLKRNYEDFLLVLRDEEQGNEK